MTKTYGLCCKIAWNSYVFIDVPVPYLKGSSVQKKFISAAEWKIRCFKFFLTAVNNNWFKRNWNLAKFNNEEMCCSYPYYEALIILILDNYKVPRHPSFLLNNNSTPLSLSLFLSLPLSLCLSPSLYLSFSLSLFLSLSFTLSLSLSSSLSLSLPLYLSLSSSLPLSLFLSLTGEVGLQRERERIACTRAC